MTIFRNGHFFMYKSSIIVNNRVKKSITKDANSFLGFNFRSGSYRIGAMLPLFFLEKVQKKSYFEFLNQCL